MTEIDYLTEAMIHVESGGDPNALGDYIGDVPLAVGVLQIHQIMVKEANRILGEQRFRLDDRKDAWKSKEMLHTYACYLLDPPYNNTIEQVARKWNAGKYWQGKQASEYWEKVKKEITILKGKHYEDAT